MFGFKVLVILTFIVFCDKLVPVTEFDSEGVTHHRALAFYFRIKFCYILLYCLTFIVFFDKLVPVTEC
ncbi:hypothetical protein, partial [Klebsiella pneumoniae]|uniref:hypothetical protein n=1 Tax=Klebsiella pneumoniae TaxID=573 RepID=UPI001D0DA704